jgi:hypothetical protein
MEFQINKNEKSKAIEKAQACKISFLARPNVFNFLFRWPEWRL